MDLTLAPNPLHKEPQTLSFDKIATLIGENGSGKSCILQSIFNTKLAKEGFDNLRVVCFSSGQNESFSQEFSKYLKYERRTNQTLSLESFYYDKSWSKLLIFLSTCLHADGRVRKFLRTNNYVDEQGLTETSLRKEDTSTKLTVKFRVAKHFMQRVEEALRVEKMGFEIETLRSTPYFHTLASFIENNVDPDYEFEDTLRKRTIEISSDTLFATSYEVERPRPEEEERRDQQLNVHPTVSFFTQLADNNYFIDRTELKLKLKDDLELDQLSDGEYQILFLYALIDLFDDENTLFLLDEADSHLHYKNIERLWHILSEVKGQVITTTHLLDSITANEFEAIRVVEKGRIHDENKLKRLINRLSILSRASTVEYEICAKISHMALLDDYNDWDIFIRLAKQKGLDTSLLDCVYAFKKTSSYANENESFGKAKIQWAESLSKVDCDLVTSQMYLICDRDEATLDIDPVSGVKVRGEQYRNQLNAINWPSGKRVSPHLLAWKRREIKNYLLSFSALSHHGKLDEINNENLAQTSHLQLNDPADNDGIRTLRAKEIINPIVNSDEGLCQAKLQDYINLIPPEEISEDIEKMYQYIVSKL